MKIHTVCTKNGLLNEGMNNIEAHFSKRFLKNHIVTNSSVKNVFGIISGALKSDCVLIFARAVKKLYWLTSFATLFNKNIWLVIVQKPEEEFILKNNKKPLKCNYLYLSKDDVKDIKLAKGKKIEKFNVGINKEKFKPISKEKISDLKKKYGINEEKPLIVHVGHASKGRGVEDLAYIDSDKYERLFVDSGIFENPEQKEFLESHHVKIISGFLENIEEIYQMADAYLFPTKDGNFVISVPLSVMESLSCGTAAVSYKVIGAKNCIATVDEKSIIEIESRDELIKALQEAISSKSEKSLLKKTLSWDEAADFTERIILKK